MPVRVHVSVAGALARRRPAGPRVRSLLRRAVRAALAERAIRAAEISVALLDDAGIEDLNARYLERRRPTDVLAFALYRDEEPPVGDVYIGYEQAARQAASLGVSLDEELARLAIHGTLHVLGFDHPDGAGRERSEMWALQESVLREVMGA